MNYVAIIKIEHNGDRTVFRTETYTLEEAEYYFQEHTNDYKRIYKDDLDNLKINTYLIDLNENTFTGDIKNERNTQSCS